MHLAKKPFEFWHYKDVRKKKLQKPAPPAITPSNVPVGTVVKGLISHHTLLPLSGLPQTLVNRLRADLTLQNPDFIKAMKYGKGLVSYAIPEYVRFYAMDTQWLGIPRSAKMSYLHKRFKEAGLELQLEDTRPEFEQVTFKARNEIKPLFYQHEAINQILGGNVVIKLRCGRGKTMLALMAVEKIRMRTLILVRTNILLGQWVDSIKQVFDVTDDQIGIINGDTKREGLITVATEQSLVALPRKEKRRIGETYGHVILDEAHETGAAQYRDFMTFFKARKVTGLTATPEREDGMTPVLKLYIGPIVEIDDLGELTTEIRLRRTNFAYAFTSKKDKYHELLDALIHNTARNARIVDDVVDLVMQGEQVVVYSSRIEHMEILQEMFKQRMPEVTTDILASEHHGQTLKVSDQESVRNRLRSKEIMVLFGGKIIEQGFDCPPLSAVVLATPTKSRRLIEQVLGRAQREYPGKARAILLDYVDEATQVLKFQFFSKNRRVYKRYHKKWLAAGV